MMRIKKYRYFGGMLAAQEKWLGRMAQKRLQAGRDRNGCIRIRAVQAGAGAVQSGIHRPHAAAARAGLLQLSAGYGLPCVL